MIIFVSSISWIYGANNAIEGSVGMGAAQRKWLEVKSVDKQGSSNVFKYGNKFLRLKTELVFKILAISRT